MREHTMQQSNQELTAVAQVHSNNIQVLTDIDYNLFAKASTYAPLELQWLEKAIRVQISEQWKLLDDVKKQIENLPDSSYSLKYHYIDQDISLDDDTFIE